MSNFEYLEQTETSAPNFNDEYAGDMDFGAALQYIASVLPENDQTAKEDIAKAANGDVVAIESLIELTGKHIQQETDNGVGADIINRLVVAKIALEAHEETLKQVAVSDAAIASRLNEELSIRVSLADKARRDAEHALGTSSDKNGNSTNDPEDTSTNIENHDNGQFNDKQRFNEILYKVGDRLGLDSPNSLVGISFDDMLPKQREAVYYILEGAANQSNDSGFSRQTLFSDTKNAINNVMNGVALGARSDYSLAV